MRKSIRSEPDTIIMGTGKTDLNDFERRRSMIRQIMGGTSMATASEMEMSKTAARLGSGDKRYTTAPNDPQ